MKGCIRIIGNGAVGKALAYSLGKAGPSISIYGRSGVEASHFRLCERGRDYDVAIEKKSEFPDLVFVTTKAYDLPEALTQNLFEIPPSTPIVLLANGYIEPLIAPFRSAYPEHTFIKGLVTRGAKFRDDGVLELSDEGKIAWGNAKPVTPLELELFLAVRELERDTNACRSRKIKWFINTVVNTLSGAYRLKANGEVLSHPEYETLKREVFQVMGELWPGEFPDEKALNKRIDDLVVMTKDNENSMAVDVRLKRRLEIDVLSGTAKTVVDHEKKFPLLMKLHNFLETQKF